jgi:hypothetical protein
MNDVGRSPRLDDGRDALILEPRPTEGAYVVLAGVVTVGNLVGLELRQMPSVAEVLIAAGAILLLAIGLVVIRAMAGKPIANGIQHPNADRNAL